MGFCREAPSELSLGFSFQRGGRSLLGLPRLPVDSLGSGKEQELIKQMTCQSLVPIPFFRADASAFRARSLAPVPPARVCTAAVSRLGRAVNQSSCDCREPALPPSPSWLPPRGQQWDRTGCSSSSLAPCACVRTPGQRSGRGRVSDVGGGESGSCSALQGKISSVCLSWELVCCLTCFCYSPAHRLHRGCSHIKYSHLRRWKLSMLSQ